MGLRLMMALRQVERTGRGQVVDIGLYDRTRPAGRAITLSGKRNPSVREFVRLSAHGTIGEFPCFVGTASQVANRMEKWFGSACDGFVIAATHIPGSYEDFVRLVVPELQRRGPFRTEYAGATLRENLGIARPEVGSWRRRGNGSARTA